MPLVTIQLMEGREPERIEMMTSAVAEAISRSIGAPIETVRVMVNEMQPHQYSVGGKPIRVVFAERDAAARASDPAEGTASSASPTDEHAPT